MATTTYLSQPAVIEIDGTDVTDQCSAVGFSIGAEALTATAFGDTGARSVGGLQTVDGTITLFASYGAAEIEGILASVVGAGNTEIIVRKDIGAPAADNPEWTISNTMIAAYSPTYEVGQLQMFDVSFSGGTWARAV